VRQIGDLAGCAFPETLATRPPSIVAMSWLRETRWSPSTVFHHIEPEFRPKAIRDISELLRERGNIFIFEHNPFNPITNYLVKTCIFDADAIP
jgi:hypothetical protein